MLFCLSSIALAQEHANSSVGSLPAMPPQSMTMLTRPAAPSFGPEGLIKLDAVVEDQAGKPVSGLAAKDFTLLENGQANRVVSFQAFDGTSATRETPVEVIVVLDELDLPVSLVSYERNSVEAFLRQNGGHLAQPVSIFSLIETGLWLRSKPSNDGNALADRLAHNREVELVRTNRGSQLGRAPASLGAKDLSAMAALKALGQIAAAERQKPGRKLLLWVGPGWGVGSGAYAEGVSSKENTFYTIRWFSTLLREARVSLYSFSAGETDPRSHLYLAYLRGVQSPHDASFMNLYRKVLAVQSGGRVFDPINDLASQIESCVRGAEVFYTLSFDPLPASHPNEYHDLKVEVDKPGLTARTSTGYYDEPYYIDEQGTPVKRLTVEQLEQILQAAHDESDGALARRLSGLALTERLSEAQPAAWTSPLRGAKTRQALVALADASVFLNPPAGESLGDPPPDAAAQQSMISSAADYLKNEIPRLPNFVALRTTLRYQETAALDEGNTVVQYEPLHLAENFKETVLYRNGAEVADPGGQKRKKRSAKDPYLITYGTFGPALNFIRDIVAVPTNLSWSRWERGSSGPVAIFQYTVPAQRSLYQLWGCCLPDGDGTMSFDRRSGYQGEVAIDPESGAILRFVSEAQLGEFPIANRSDFMVEYGPVEIGGKTYICPVRSVSIVRMRSIVSLAAWDESFRTYGPLVTMLNDIHYTNYHIFRGESRLITDINSVTGQSPR